jgi:hypothetical protein
MLGPIAAAQDTVDRMTAFAVATNQEATLASTPVDILIIRWSTDAERSLMIDALLTDGPSKMQDVLSDLPRVAIIRQATTLGIEFHFASRQVMEDKSERIILLAGRQITLWKVPQRADIDQYPFTLVEVRLGPDGTGEGKVSLATRAIADKRNKKIIMEDYAHEPVRLENVKR